MQSILIGGIAFDNPFGAGSDEVAADNKEFPLFASFDAIQQAQYTIKVPFRVYFDSSVAGLSPGAPVIFQGIKLGEVTDVHLQIDPKDLSARIPVTFTLQPQRWRVMGERRGHPAASGRRQHLAVGRTRAPGAARHRQPAHRREERHARLLSRCTEGRRYDG